MKKEVKTNNESLKGKTAVENATSLNEYLMDNFTPEERAALKQPKYFYEVTFNKPGGIPNASNC